MGVEADVSRLQELIIEAAETADHTLRLDLRLSHRFHQLRCRAFPLLPVLHEVCQSIEKRRIQVRRRGFFSPILLLRQFPNTVMERKRNRLVLHVPACDPERTALCAAVRPFQQQNGIQTAHDAVGAEDLVEGVLAVLRLPDVVDQQNADVMLIRNAFQADHGVVVAGVHIAALRVMRIADFLERVDDDKPSTRVTSKLLCDLLLQSAVELVAHHGEAQLRHRFLIQPVHPPLDTRERILQAEIQYLTFLRGSFPHRESL